MFEPWWKILVVDESSASQRDIKRAYAKLLKQHRPDEDPEGFQRVHDAYQQALTALAWRESEAEAETRPTAIPPAPLVEMLAEGLAETPTAPPKPKLELPPHLQAEADKIRPLEHLPEISEFLDNVTAGAVLDGLEKGDTELATSVLNHVLIDDPSHFKVSLAEAIIDDPNRFADPATSIFICDLASSLAFGHADMANNLLDHVFASLPPKQRSYQIHRPSQLIALGKAFRGSVKRRHLGFWNAAFINPDDIDWESPLAVGALREVANFGHWAGYEMLEEVVPEQKQSWHEPAQRSAPVFTPRPSRTGPGFLDWVVGKWWMFPVIIFVLSTSLRVNEIRNPSGPDLEHLRRGLKAMHDDDGWRPTSATNPPGVIEEYEHFETKKGPVQSFRVERDSGIVEYHTFRNGTTRMFVPGDYEAWRDRQVNILMKINARKVQAKIRRPESAEDIDEIFDKIGR